MRVKREGDKLYLFPETDLVASRIEKLRDFFKKQLNEHSDIDHIYLNVQDVDIVDSLGVNLICGVISGNYRKIEDHGNCRRR